MKVLVFKLTPVGQETVLHSFTGLADGGTPESGLIRDSAGNLYGTTFYGGLGAGVVYKMDTSGVETVLYSIGGGADGANPVAGLVRDSKGNLYGTAVNSGPGGDGVVFELSAGGVYTVLYGFTGGADGGIPFAGVARDSAGTLYGTTFYAGQTSCDDGCGVVYQIEAAGNFTVLHSFTGGADGFAPRAGVALDLSGNLYGNTTHGGGAAGVFYQLTP